MNDLSYQYHCINSAQCSVTDRIAALQDYVGAAYGENGKVQYDKKLTQTERQYVETQFGKLPADKKKLTETVIQDYLTQAQRKFFVRLGLDDNRAQQCTRDFIYQEIKKAKAYFLGGAHGCGPKFSQLYLQNGLELAIASNPDSWVFFIEGYGKDQMAPEAEAELFKQIGKALHIPLYNPLIYNATGLSVINTAATTYHRNIKEYIGYLVLAAFIMNVKQSRVPLRFFHDLLNQTIKRFCEIYELDESKAREAFFTFTEKSPAESEQAFMIRLGTTDLIRKIEAKEPAITRELIDTSNQLNIGHVEQGLSANPTRPKAFFQGGRMHLALVESVYKPK